MNCDYGCNNPAIKYFKTTKRWCCSESVNCCPAKRERDHLKKKGKNPWEGKQHPRGMLGKKSWLFGQRMPDEMKKKISLALKGNPKCLGIASTPEKELLRKRKISETAKKNCKSGGYRLGSGVGKKCWYDSSIAGRVHLQSTYELRLAKIFDSLKFVWFGNYKKFPYKWEEKDVSYIPDFIVYTNKGIVFFETKGYITDKDKAKWKAFPHKLRIIQLLDLEKLERLSKTK